LFIWPDCVPCILKMSIGVIRLAIKDEDKIKRVIDQILQISHLRGEDWYVTSPEIIRHIWRKILEVSGIDDPLKEVKADQNERALKVYPLAKDIVFKSDDPFLQALKLAIAGNFLDAMVTVGEGSSEVLIEALDKFPIDVAVALKFKERLERSYRIIYLTDNCGEIVFDKLFLEVLHQNYQKEITVVVRKLPILNDATLLDARSVGLDRIVRVIDNGIDEPFPGTMISKLSPEVRALVESADLIISKGVGNYDSLTEEPQLKGKISFLFHGKCLPTTVSLNVPMGSLIVFNF
jgi:damage-control phosphatase, subfamily I